MVCYLSSNQLLLLHLSITDRGEELVFCFCFCALDFLFNFLFHFLIFLELFCRFFACVSEAAASLLCNSFCAIRFDYFESHDDHSLKKPQKNDGLYENYGTTCQIWTTDISTSLLRSDKNAVKARNFFECSECTFEIIFSLDKQSLCDSMNSFFQPKSQILIFLLKVFFYCIMYIRSTRLLVSGQSSEYSDCLLRFMDQ